MEPTTESYTISNTFYKAVQYPIQKKQPDSVRDHIVATVDRQLSPALSIKNKIASSWKA